MAGMLGLVGLAATLGLLAWLNRRGLRRWQRANDRRARLREMEDEIREERLPAADRARRQQRQEQADITREARRRLGWPEEGEDQP